MLSEACLLRLGPYGDRARTATGSAQQQKPDVTETRRSIIGGRANGFSYQVNSAGEIVITHHGKRATVLRGGRAQEFLADVEQGDPQELMARLTGNYKRGNERTARQHPRNR